MACAGPATNLPPLKFNRMRTYRRVSQRLFCA